ncbi:DUF3164 family protein, partial [Escherichia coli]
LSEHKTLSISWSHYPESLQVAMSKTYINFREKDKHGKLINIPLDIAAI